MRAEQQTPQMVGSTSIERLTLESIKAVPWFFTLSKVWVVDGNHGHLHGAIILGEPFLIPNSNFLNDKPKNKILREMHQNPDGTVSFDDSLFENGGIVVVEVQWIECRRKDIVECCRLAGPIFVDDGGNIADRRRSRRRTSSDQPQQNAKPYPRSFRKIKKEKTSKTPEQVQWNLEERIPPIRAVIVRSSDDSSDNPFDSSDSSDNERESDHTPLNNSLSRTKFKKKQCSNGKKKSKIRYKIISKEIEDGDVEVSENGTESLNESKNESKKEPIEKKNHIRRRLYRDPRVRRNEIVTNYQIKRDAMKRLDRRHRIASSTKTNKKDRIHHSVSLTSKSEPNTDSTHLNRLELAKHTYVDFGDSDFTEFDSSDDYN